MYLNNRLESKLSENWDGDYNSSIGRFINEDPIGFKGRDANLYRYSINNPVLFTDPSGKIIPALPIIVGINVTIKAIFATGVTALLVQQLRELFRALDEIEKLESLERENIGNPELIPGSKIDREKFLRNIEKELNLEKNSCKLS